MGTRYAATFTDANADIRIAGFLTLEDGAQQSTTALTSAQILSLSSSPLVVVAAPGPGRIIIPQVVAFSLTAATPYALHTELQVQDVDGNAVGVTSTTFLAQSSNTLAVDSSGYELDGVNILRDDVVNQPLQVRTVSGNPTTGTGTVTVVVYYSVLTV